jgi:hypothetical protein
MTNPCFQDTPFATVMKGKHVLNEPDETDLESYHVEESSGQAMVGDREVEQNDPPLPMYGSSYGYGTNLIAGGEIASHSGSGDIGDNDLFSVGEQGKLTRRGEGNQSGSESLGLLLSQAIAAHEGNQSAPENLQPSDPIGNLFSQMNQSNPAETQRPGKTTKKKLGAPENLIAEIRKGQRLRLETNRYAPAFTTTPNKYAPQNGDSPPVVFSSILLPIQVTREKSNCAFGNAVNLLTYINHFNTGLKQKMMMLGAEAQGCRFGEIQKLIHQCGYDVNVLPKISTFTELESFVTRMDLPMLINLELKFPLITLGHVIGISPYKSSETSNIEYHIIDGAHPEMKAMLFNKENIDWCCGNDLKLGKINQGFVFVPGRKRVLQMLQDKSGYHIVPGTAVCLTKNAKNIGKEDVKLPVIHERVLALNVSDKEKSEYVKIWKQLMNEHKKKTK